MKFIMEKAGKLHERLINRQLIADSRRPLAILVLGACFLVLGSFVTHPYYVTVTELEYRPAQKEIQVACKIFTDDLEDALKAEIKKQVTISDTKDKAAKLQLIFKYLQGHLKILVDGKAVTYEMIGYELEQEAAWNYLLIKNVAPFKKITVYNDVLYSLRDGQTNIVHVRNNGETKSYRINAPETYHTFSW
jgi:SpoU rRNA methylase family enzyme